MKTSGFFASMLVVSLSALVSLDAGATTYTYVNIDFPGADDTDTRGINNATTIAGYYDVSGVSSSFIYIGGALTSLPAPPSGITGVAAEAINDSNVIVGTFSTAASPDQAGGFFWNGTAYAFVYPPSGYDSMEFRDLNGAGVVAGYAANSGVIASGGSGLAAWLGFIYDPATGVFTPFTDPVNHIFENSTFTIAHGINGAGQVNGSVALPGFITGHRNGQWGFLREPDGTVTKFRVGGDDNHTRARGINDNGVMSGQVDMIDPVTSIPVTHSFVGTSGGFQLLDATFSGGVAAAGTYAENINNLGQVAGLWDDGTNFHGFYATPVSVPTGTTSGGAYTFSVEVVADVPTFIDPQVALGFEYAIGATGPNFASTRPPIGFGDNKYTILVHGRAFPVVGGQLFDFRANGYPNGVARFRITGIDDVAKVDPLNVLAFPTQVAFVANGTFSGTMTPLCLRHPLPPHANAEALTRAIANCIR